MVRGKIQDGRDKRTQRQCNNRLPRFLDLTSEFMRGRGSGPSEVTDVRKRLPDQGGAGSEPNPTTLIPGTERRKNRISMVSVGSPEIQLEAAIPHV